MFTNLEMETFFWIVFLFNDAPSVSVVPPVNAKIKYAESQDWCLA